MNSVMSNQHLTESEIVRVVDAQLEKAESERVSAHLHACATCEATVERARQRTLRLAALLEETDFVVPALAMPAPSARITSITQARTARSIRTRWLPERRWLRAAAGIVLLLGALFSITPVRAAIVEWARAVWGAVSSDVVDPAAPPARSEATEPAQLGARVQFAPDGNALYLDFAADDAASTVDIRRTSDGRISAQASHASVELVVLVNRLRVRNEAARAVHYAVEIPRSVDVVVISVSGRTLRRVTASDLEGGSFVTPVSARPE